MMMMIIIISSYSCSKGTNDNHDCTMTVDTVNIIDEKIVGTTEFYLVLRIAGWHDKTEIIELYDTKPTFDRCSKSDVEPVYGNSLELDKTVTHLYLDTESKSLNIEYKDGEPSKDYNRNLKIEVK
jgi:hypothetical protein